MKSAVLVLVACGAVVAFAEGCSGPTGESGATSDEVTGSSYECTKPEASGELGPRSSTMPRVVAVRAAGHAGFDRLVVELSGPGARFNVEETSSATFIADGSGEEMVMPGTAGLEVVLHGIDWGAGGDFGNAAVGDAKIMTKMTPGQLFEGDFRLGVGLQRQGCYHVTQLANPTRLVIDVQNDGSAPSWGAEPGVPGFTCAPFPADPATGKLDVSHPAAGASVAMKLVRKRAAAHPEASTPYDRFVLEFAGGEVPPEAWLSPRKSATFTGLDDQPIALAGQAGLVLVTTGGVISSGARKVPAASGMTAFTGAVEIDNFEGYSDWGIGLSKETCYRAFPLTDPPRLVVDVKR